MNSRSHLALTAAFGFIGLCLTATGPLTGAELATDFPKPPIPLELAPRMGRPFNDNAVFQQQIPVPVWGWTLPGAEVSVTGEEGRLRAAGADAGCADAVVVDPSQGRKLALGGRQDRWL